MQRGDHQRVRELFSAVMDLSPTERAAYLDDACAGDPALRHQVTELLRYHESGDNLADAQPGLIRDLAPADDRLPERIGSYAIERLLGRGGMGVVYLARQADPARTVALKVMHGPALNDALQARFRREAHLLARLRHPGIAHIYEAGQADIDGRPCAWFAMEYIDGRTLTEHASTAGLDHRQRLALLLQICDAVQHAHDQGVIHRDLKPANILVDRDGRARVLDFGVARVTRSDRQTLTLQTDAGQIIGTVQYMSPEQIAGETETLDGRSDVYALGVIAYELLSGELPYALRGRNLPQMARAIQETEPTRISSIDTALRGDVETILAKALEKDRRRRYASPRALAEDFRAFLNHQPIRARPATTGYQLRKFAQRNPGLVASFGFAMVALLAGFIASTVLYLQADQARQRTEQQRQLARREADRAAAINAFLIDDLLAAANPWEQGGRDITVAATLDQAAAGIDDRFADQPELACAVRAAIADSYRALGLFGQAAPHYQRALELVEQLPREDPALHTRLLLGSAENLKATSVLDRAEAHARAGLALAERHFGPRAAQVAALLETLGSVLTGRGQHEQAEQTLRRALALLADSDDVVARARITNTLGSALYYATRFDEAMQCKTDALELLRAHFGPTHPHVAQTLNDIGSTYSERGENEQSRAYLDQALPLLETHLGADHAITLICRRTLANTLSFLGKDDEAEPMLAQVIASSTRTLGPLHADTFAARNSLATLRLRARRHEEAAPIYDALYEDARETLGPRHPDTLKYAQNLAWCAFYLGDAERAERLFVLAAETLEQTQGLAHGDTRLAWDGRAQFLQAQERFDEAADALGRILEGRRLAGTPQDLDHALLLHRYASALMQAERYADAVTPFEQCIAICREGFPEHDWRTALAQSKYGECLSRTGRHDDAERELLASYHAHDHVPQPDTQRSRTRSRLFDHYTRAGNPQAARDYASPESSE